MLKKASGLKKTSDKEAFNILSKRFFDVCRGFFLEIKKKEEIQLKLQLEINYSLRECELFLNKFNRRLKDFHALHRRLLMRFGNGQN